MIMNINGSFIMVDQHFGVHHLKVDLTWVHYDNGEHDVGKASATTTIEGGGKDRTHQKETWGSWAGDLGVALAFLSTSMDHQNPID